MSNEVSLAMFINTYRKVNILDSGHNSGMYPVMALLTTEFLLGSVVEHLRADSGLGPASLLGTQIFYFVSHS